MAFRHRKDGAGWGPQFSPLVRPPGHEAGHRGCHEGLSEEDFRVGDMAVRAWTMLRASSVES